MINASASPAYASANPPSRRMASWKSSMARRTSSGVRRLHAARPRRYRSYTAKSGGGLHGHAATAVLERAVAADDHEPRDAGQVGGDTFGHAVGEVLVPLRPAEVLEGQDRDRGSLGGSRRGAGPRPRPPDPQARPQENHRSERDDEGRPRSLED